VKQLSIIPIQHAELCFADTHRVLQYRLEYGLQRAGRRADNAEHIGGSGLLLQRFGEIVRALA
jgi:hypothetical protein